MAPELLVVTPWYPTSERPYLGTFVREWTRALGLDPSVVTVLHVSASTEASHAVSRSVDEVATVVKVTAPVPRRASRTATAEAMRTALRSADLGGLLAAPVVHAHVGMPGGWAVAGLLPTTTRLILTEHASYLPAVLADHQARARYREVVERAEVVLTVGEAQARLLRAALPDLRDRVHATGNPIDGERFPAAPPRATPPRRWLSLANLVPGKGVDRVIDAFAAWSPEHDAGRLVIAGDGPLRAELVDRAARHGTADRVELLGAVLPERVPALLGDVDVLVHLSDGETFGLAALEAVLSGVPVVSTATDGARQTMGAAVAAGAAVLVPVHPSPAEVARAVDRAGASATPQALRTAREALLDRFGAPVLAARVGRVLAGEPLDPDAHGRPVVTLATSPGECRALEDLHDALLRAGARVRHLTTDDAEAVAVDARLAAVPLATLVAGPAQRVAAATGRVLAGVLAALAAGLSVPGRRRRGGPARRASRAIDRLAVLTASAARRPSVRRLQRLAARDPRRLADLVARVVPVDRTTVVIASGAARRTAEQLAARTDATLADVCSGAQAAHLADQVTADLS